MEHVHSKFKPGDKVYLNGRTPHWLSKRNYRRRARTIVKMFYHPELKATLYYLGDNRHDSFATPVNVGFRSYQLKLASGKRGRPREKRKYNKTGKYTHNTNPIVKIPAKPPDSFNSTTSTGCDESVKAVGFHALRR